MFVPCYAVFSVLSSFASIMTGKLELVAFLCIVAFKNGIPVFCLKLRVREPTLAYFS